MKQLKYLLKFSLSKIELIFFLLKKFLNQRQFIYISSVAVGISVAIAVIVLKSFSHWVSVFSIYIDKKYDLPFSNSILPVIGILLTVFVIRNFLDGQIDKGTFQIMYAVAKKRSILPIKQMYAQIITSCLTVGMGGSAGLESPITITGAAFGSNFALKYRLTYKERSLLLACGVAAGIGAAFNAPIAGVLFAIEVVLTEISVSAFIPIMLSAATGAIVSSLLLKEGILFSFKNITDFHSKNIPFYIILGVFSGFISIHYSRNFRRIEKLFKRITLSPYRKALFGAIFLALLIFIFPALFGEGYQSIKALADNNPEKILELSFLSKFDNKWVVLILVGFTMLLKVFATGITLGAGGNGGNFAPSLFVGAFLGYITSTFFNFLGFIKLPVSNFTLVGMSGVLSGLFHSPLTAIFLIAEITGGYDLMLPLMIVSSVSYAISKQFEPYSFDIKHLAKKGEVFTDDKDKNILQTINIEKLIDRDYIRVYEGNSLESFIEKIKETEATVFPVFDSNETLKGLIYLDDIRSILFSAFKIKHTKTQEITQVIDVYINYDDSASIILDKFENTKHQILPVFQDQKLVGFIQKSDILERYRKILKEIVVE